MPVILPEIKDEKSIELLKKGMPLKNMEKFKKCKCPRCGNTEAERETDTLDTFVDSSWYFLRFLDPHLEDFPINLKRVKDWMPVDIYVGGMEHAIMHLLYARFIHKFLADVYGDGKIPREPFKELIV
jgi:leucyl-tRNA synthetase